jgi:hypothetical protein
LNLDSIIVIVEVAAAETSAQLSELSEVIIKYGLPGLIYLVNLNIFIK